MNDATTHVAILGAGPIGLEAALAAADHGYSFTLYEAAPAVAAHVREWAHVRLFSPWGLNISDRMRAHLERAGHPLPTPEDRDCPLGGELVAQVLDPVAALPELAPHVRTSSRVIEIGREGLLKSDEIGTGARRTHRFRLLIADAEGAERVKHADVVLDCTGTYGNPNTTGDGGIAAPGERLLEEEIRRHIPDFAAEPDAWAGKTVLLVGAGHSAQTAADDLSRFAEQHPGTRVLWALRKESPRWPVADDDPLPERSRLAQRATELAAGASDSVEPLFGVVVDAMRRRGGKTEVDLRRRDGSTRSVLVDWVLSLTGSVGDHSLYRQLQVHECYATSGPMKLAAALLGESTDADCLSQESRGAETLANPEPDFFIVGSKSYGRNNTFLMRVGWQQISEVFDMLDAHRRAAAATVSS